MGMNAQICWTKRYKKMMGRFFFYEQPHFILLFCWKRVIFFFEQSFWWFLSFIFLGKNNNSFAGLSAPEQCNIVYSYENITNCQYVSLCTSYVRYARCSHSMESTFTWIWVRLCVCMCIANASSIPIYTLGIYPQCGMIMYLRWVFWMKCMQFIPTKKNRDSLQR